MFTLLRNGSARQRRRDKRSAARAENASAEKIKANVIEATETVEKVPNTTENSDAGEANEFETEAKDIDSNKKNTEKVETSVKDEVCPDYVYENTPKQLNSGQQNAMLNKCFRGNCFMHLS